MSQNKFEILQSHLHTCDDEINKKNKKQYKFVTLINDTNELFKSPNISGGQVCIDKSMMLWGGPSKFPSVYFK